MTDLIGRGHPPNTSGRRRKWAFIFQGWRSQPGPSPISHQFTLLRGARRRTPQDQEEAEIRVFASNAKTGPALSVQELGPLDEWLPPGCHLYVIVSGLFSRLGSRDIVPGGEGGSSDSNQPSVMPLRAFLLCTCQGLQDCAAQLQPELQDAIHRHLGWSKNWPCIHGSVVSVSPDSTCHCSAWLFGRRAGVVHRKVGDSAFPQRISHAAGLPPERPRPARSL